MKFLWDERTESLSGKIATIFLGLTQVAMLGIILYRRYYLGQPEEAYNDLRIVLAFSVFGYIAARLYFGALIPKFSLKSLALIYVGFVLFLFVVLSLRPSWPAGSGCSAGWAGAARHSGPAQAFG